METMLLSQKENQMKISDMLLYLYKSVYPQYSTVRIHITEVWEMKLNILVLRNFCITLFIKYSHYRVSSKWWSRKLDAFPQCNLA